MLAQAIHALEPGPGGWSRSIVGRLPADMVIREPFGHRRGAFTSAVDTRSRVLRRPRSRGPCFSTNLASLPPVRPAAPAARGGERPVLSRVGRPHCTGVGAPAGRGPEPEGRLRCRAHPGRPGAPAGRGGDPAAGAAGAARGCVAAGRAFCARARHGAGPWHQNRAGASPLARECPRAPPCDGPGRHLAAGGPRHAGRGV
ncbi:MAG: hypothetical protein IPF77_15975 [Gemmatimonadetes bacterium]|nr:hypothetical protein [Gemmatimonadota bacterium]